MDERRHELTIDTGELDAIIELVIEVRSQAAMKSKKVGDGDHEINTIEPKADRVEDAFSGEVNITEDSLSTATARDSRGCERGGANERREKGEKMEGRD